MTTLQERMAFVFADRMQGGKPERGLQAEIVELCKVSRPTVSAWFNNEEKVATMDRTYADKICARYRPDVSPAWLADDLPPKMLQGAVSARENVREYTVEGTQKQHPVEAALWRIANAASEIKDVDERQEIADLLKLVVANPAANAKDLISIIVRRLLGGSGNQTGSNGKTGTDN